MIHHESGWAMTGRTATVHIDGAARGNPGPAAYSFVIEIPGQVAIEEFGLLGSETNNVAEYTALVRVLERAHKEGLQQVHIHSDSELLVKQMNGEYRVKNADLKAMYDEAQGLLKHFHSVRIQHVRREQNKRADELCNIALDGGVRPPSIKTARPAQSPATVVSDSKVRENALLCLRTAAEAWQRNDAKAATPEQVWEQLWSVLEEADILKRPKKKH